MQRKKRAYVIDFGMSTLLNSKAKNLTRVSNFNSSRRKKGNYLQSTKNAHRVGLIGNEDPTTKRERFEQNLDQLFGQRRDRVFRSQTPLNFKRMEREKSLKILKNVNFNHKKRFGSGKVKNKKWFKQNFKNSKFSKTKNRTKYKGSL